MSWQDYVDNQLVASKCVTKAAIAGHDGTLWAKSEGFEVSAKCHTEIFRRGGGGRCVCVCECESGSYGQSAMMAVDWAV